VSFALDVNILLYASDSDSPYHERAKAFLETCMQQAELFCLGWPTVMSYLRIATHPSVMVMEDVPEDYQTQGVAL